MTSAWRVITFACIIGILTGILSGLPYLQYLNIYCLWIIAGGILSTYLLKRSGKIGLIDAAFAGAFTAIISLTISAALNLGMFWFHVGLPYSTVWQLLEFIGLGEFLIVIILSIVLMIYMLLGVILGACSGVIGTKIMG